MDTYDRLQADIDAAVRCNLAAARTVTGPLGFRADGEDLQYLVHPSTREPGAWQITTLSADGLALSHITAPTRDMAIRAVSGQWLESMGGAIGSARYRLAPVHVDPARNVEADRVRRLMWAGKVA
jgi:hypothetical protein